ncbi:hypothetical protein Tco_0669825 [Tanacetum coccineum]
MSIILYKKLSGNSQSSTKIKTRVNDEMISTSVKADKPSIHHTDASQYSVPNLQNRNLFSESKKITLPSLNHLYDDYWDESKETGGEKDLEAHYNNAKPLGKALPRKEKDWVYALSLIKSTKLDLEARLMGNALRKNRSHDPKFKDYIELSDLNEPLELRHDQVVDFGPTIEEGEVIDTPIKEMVKPRLYNFIMKDKLEFKWKSVVGTFMNAPIFVETFSVVTDFAVIEDIDHYRDEEMGDVIVGKEFCDSFFKPYLNIQEKNNIGDEQGQTKRKCSNTSNSNDEQPNKRVCKAEKFEAIKYSLGPNEEYIAIRRCEYDA